MEKRFDKKSNGEEMDRGVDKKQPYLKRTDPEHSRNRYNEQNPSQSSGSFSSDSTYNKNNPKNIRDKGLKRTRKKSLQNKLPFSIFLALLFKEKRRMSRDDRFSGFEIE